MPASLTEINGLIPKMQHVKIFTPCLSPCLQYVMPPHLKNWSSLENVFERYLYSHKMFLYPHENKIRGKTSKFA